VRRANAGCTCFRANQYDIVRRVSPDVRALRLHNFHEQHIGFGPLAGRRLGLLQPTPFDTAGRIQRAQMAARLAKFADLDPLVLVHAPPYGLCLRPDSPGPHAGSRALREFIEKSQPALFLLRHIHEAGRSRDPHHRTRRASRPKPGICRIGLNHMTSKSWNANTRPLSRPSPGRASIL